MRRSPCTEILGKTITGVVIKSAESGSPSASMHLIFSDDTSLEIYLRVAYFCFCATLDSGGIEYARTYMTGEPYMASGMKIEYEAYLDQNGNVIENGQLKDN